MRQKDKAKKIRGNGQSTLEYGVFIVIIVAALLATQVYFKRGIQGRLRSHAEELSGGTSYSLGATNANSTITREIIESSISYTDADDRDISESNTTINQTTNKTEEALSFREEPRR